MAKQKQKKKQATHSWEVDVIIEEAKKGPYQEEVLGVFTGTLDELHKFVISTFLKNVSPSELQTYNDVRKQDQMDDRYFNRFLLGMNEPGQLESKSQDEDSRGVLVEWEQVRALDANSRPVKIPVKERREPPPGGNLKVVKQLVADNNDKLSVGEIVQLVEEKTGMSTLAARTYVYNARRQLDLPKKEVPPDEANRPQNQDPEEHPDS